MTDDDIYNLAGEEPSPKPRPSAAPRRPADAEALEAEPAGAGAAAAAPVSARTLGYARPGTANATIRGMEVGPNARGAAADPMTLRREYLRLFKVPLLLIVLGSVIYVACGLLIARDLTRAAFWISMSFSWDLAVIGLGMLVGSRLVDLESESTTTLLRQVAALVLAFSAIFWPIMWMTGGTLCGFTSAWCLATLLNVYLLSYFFELDSVEALQLTVILFAVRLAANFIWLTTVGTFGYLP